ncbi:TetR/AcrR family transcriptional regulator C-terminal domain-containing protein [uncultured Ruminococcus sp.]|uniref:TetR/AcrR family transcriptional regulator C-terminal domain-containing protein n=1 Tax=uncultured Ruminococcus sp. TaxID=165186 RepID=UPI0025E1CFE4|nr:TetR/AcrR family transcriptional regulator C-terminal domain-containing protein [uncultured Ruminococcus sp.]
MKHEVTTLNTKKMLSASLKHCMEKKSLSKITVTDIVTDCGLNRKTFYYHFQDVPDLLKWTLEQEAVDVVKQFDLLNELEEALRFAVRYIRENSHMINCAYDSIGRDELKRFLNHDFQSIVMSIVEQIERKENVHTDPDAKKIICNFYTEGMAGELVDLLKSRDAAQDEKSIRCISLVVRTSLEAAVISCSKMQ